MKKNRTKRILSMLLTLFMVLTLVPMTAFAANAPANEVIINGDTLNSSYPYLVSGARKASGGLNGALCTAHFNASTGTLSLWNYNGSAIAAGDAGGAKDLTVKLKGTNTITGDLRNPIDGGNLIITAEEDAFLNITNSGNSAGLLAGISTYFSETTNFGGGSISIKGKANITISVTNTSTTSPAKSYGLHARQGISISDSASLDITSTCHSPYDYRVYGIYTEHQSFTANTSGVIRVDVSNTQNVKPTAIRASSYSLTMVDQLLCKYNSTGIDFYGAVTKPAGFFAYNKGVVSGTPTTEIRRGSYPFRIATFVDVTNNFGKSTGEYFGGDKVELSAETLEIPFSSWQSSAGSFSSTTSPNTTFTMPYDDVTITARYNAFNYSPYFTKTEIGKGTITFNLNALPDSDTPPRLVTKTGDETTIVGGKYFYGDNLPRELTITDGTGPSQVPAGEYRVAVKIGGLWHFSEVVTVNYATTYAVTVNNGTGGGNYAAGDTVTIKGNAPEDGEVFYKWTTTDGVEFANENATTTTFVMPAKAVTVTPTYKDIAMLLGTVTITGETRFGETLTAIVTDTNAISPFIYQWKRGFYRVPIGTNSETYELVADDIDHIIYCEITTERKTNAIGGVTKNPIRKADGPAAPTGLGSTAETVAGKKDGTITGVQPGQEYALAEVGEWADIEGTTVNNLPAGDYEVRVKETPTHNPGAVATVTINPGAPATYAVHVTGGTGSGNYAEGDTVTITANEPDTGKEFDKWIAVGLSGDADYEFELNTFSFTMPDNDVAFTATYKDIPVSISSVVISPATTSVQKGTTQNFTAIVSGTGAYDSTVTWSVDGISETTISETGLLTVAEGETATSLTVTATSIVDNTKSASATVTVTDTPVTTYAVTVTDGTGGGDFAEGATVNITANAPATGKVFDKWTTSDGITFGDANTATTTFVMPAKAVTVTATYKDAPVTTYAVTVNSGTGSGNFADGATVNITANAPATGKVFDKWTTSDGITFGDANTATTTFVMPAKAVTVTATYKDAPVTTYAVTVTDGTGSGNFAAGATVNITANAPATGKVFDKWTTSDGVTFGDANTATTTFVMPAKAVTVTATYKDAPVTTYAVTVNSGTGSGNFAAGATVNITANAAETGKVFDKWTTSDGVTFGDANTATTTFVMPAKAVTVTATYKDAPVTTYAVTVNSGTGGGNFAAGATVSITANAPATGKVFDKWTTSDGITFGDANSATTTFTMPAKAVTVTATYKDAPVTTYAVTVNSGTGSGNFAAGATVNITANAPATGKVFDKWTTTDGVEFANANSATTTFVMPAKAVTVTATYKDAPATTYAVTVSSGGSGATGAGSYAKGTTVNINAGSRSSYTFTGWTSSDVTITNPNNTNASFTMPAKAVTVTANWSYSGGGGGGGGSSTIQPTVPAANGSIKVNYTASGGTAVLMLPGSKVDEIIARSKDGEVDIDLSKMGGITSAELPKTAVTAINEAGVDVIVKFPAGSITLKKDATVSIVGQAEGGSLKLELKQVAKGSLTDEQKEAVKSNDLVLDINISSGTKKISSFDGTLSITVPYSGPQPVAVWYLNDKGELEKLFCTFVDGTVSFNLDHLSLYVVGQDTAWVNPFADVKESDWFYGSVEYAFKNGLMVGTSDVTFSPYMNTTRGMIVTILHRLEGRPKSDAANAFADVGADKYYTDAVAWARDNIIVSGYGNGMFGPEDSITREQMAAILMNYAKYKGYDISMKADLSKFADGESISPWAKDAISWANAEGLIQGSGSQLMPVDNALRCQVAAILQRFIETIAK